MEKEKSDRVLYFFLVPMVAMGLISLVMHLIDAGVSVHDTYVNAQRVPELERQVCDLRGGEMVRPLFSSPRYCFVPPKEEVSTTSYYWDGKGLREDKHGGSGGVIK